MTIRIRRTAGCLVLAMAFAAAGAVAAGPGAHPALSLHKQGEQGAVLTWRSAANGAVRLGAPVFAVRENDRAKALPVAVRLASPKCAGTAAQCEYALTVNHGAAKRTGKYHVAWAIVKDKGRAVLRQVGRLSFDKPMPLDVSVTYAVELPVRQAGMCTFPLRVGVVRGFAAGASRGQSAFFTLGRGAAVRKGYELAMPVIGLGGADKPGGTLAVATDPYCGVQFRVTHRNAGKAPAALVTMATTYKGSLVPVTDERRTTALVFHRGGIDGMLTAFYDTIPHIAPGAAWIHDIHLNYYDYLGKTGCEWFDDLKKLSQKIPLAHRKSVVACLHGWYDYLGRYCFDHRTGKLADEWIAFPRTRKIQMDKAQIRKGARFAKQLGFRVVLYFADGLNSDSGMPNYPKDWIFKDERGNMRKGWTGPSTGRTYTLDPSNPEVRKFFISYAEALLKDYGREIDGLVWDETHYITQERLSKRGKALSYADRDFMTLVGEITHRVQQWRKHNPDLVFLTSDLVSGRAHGRVPYALVSHGTYQDSAMDPASWPPGLLPNYRNCLWSCNWFPIRNRDRNRIAPEYYGLPQGLSNGYGDNVGPAQMKPEMLDEVIQRFLKRAKQGGRKRYLTEPTVHVAALPCTTRQDAAGGCDGLKTGTWGFCTGRQANPWWQVDLGKPTPLGRVVIYNRCDSGMEVRTQRLKVLLSVDGSKWTQAYQHGGVSFLGYTDGKPLSVALKGARGRFVRIQLPGTDYLHLDEVEVYGVSGKANLAVGKPADQSSVSQWSTAGPAKTRLPKPARHR